ncbi:extracellular solute-binding protein [Actinopolymorpha alba]|uniref:extracellular solute-binding protein n=1 Tax=Actinopolymorpha alba TaxID=533267 RepID=UPI0003603167|nr:extracellular solute-binding protein [Actinopolymorpha alba]
MGLLAGGCTITKGTPPISTVGLDKKPAPGRKVNIEVYSVWGSTVGQGLVKLAERFEESQKDIGVRVVFAPAGIGGGSVQQKLFVAIAGRNPPDVAQLVPSQTPQWADLGIMTDLTDRFKAAGLSENDFFPGAWESMSYNGSVWQVQWDADPNFPFFWNKGVFEEVGLDPEKPPTTIDEVDEYSKKILKKNGPNIARIGMIPWDTYGASNSMFTWGWAFGGSFYDKEKLEVTPDHEYNVKALEWIVRYAKAQGGADRLAVTPPGLQLHPFSTGNIGMAPLVAPNYRDIRTNVKDMQIGSGLLPHQPPGAEKEGAGAWIGGWGMFIPSQAERKDEAWEFIKWVSTADDGTKAQWDTVGFPPAYNKSPVVETMRNDEMWKPYYDVLTTATNTRPPFTVSDFFFQRLDQEVTKAIFGLKTPLQALRKVKEDSQGELERFRKEVGSI